MANILLIEPDKILASNVSQFFKKRGHKIINRSSAQQAVEAADKFCPDVIILDLQLGGHSGVEFLHELRSYGDWQKLPVIIFSNIHPDQLGGVQAAKLGLTATAYLHKPTASLEDLAEVVERAIK